MLSEHARTGILEALPRGDPGGEFLALSGWPVEGLKLDAGKSNQDGLYCT